MRISGRAWVLMLGVALTGACDLKPAGPPAREPPPPAPPRQRVALTGQPVEALPEARFEERRALLGRRLFHDTRLSGDNSISCATCHSLDHGGAEARRTSVGIRGHVGPINAPTVLNAALNFVQFWDGRAPDLQRQAEGPVANPGEMGAEWPQVVERVRGDATYASAFAAAGYAEGVTKESITAAIAEYERSLRTPSPFDAYLLGDEGAISEQARRGYETFKSLGCPSCHSGPGIGGRSYERMGAVRNYFADRGNLTDADNGRFNVTRQESDRHKFKVPLLRNVELTAPYLHDGSQATLPDVIRVMGRYQLGIEVTDAQVEDLSAWLRSLTGTLPPNAREPVTAQPATVQPATAQPTAAPAGGRPAAAARPAANAR
jgi:cytochrome c peroxidase